MTNGAGGKRGSDGELADSLPRTPETESATEKKLFGTGNEMKRKGGSSVV